MTSGGHTGGGARRAARAHRRTAGASPTPSQTHLEPGGLGFGSHVSTAWTCDSWASDQASLPRFPRGQPRRPEAFARGAAIVSSLAAHDARRHSERRPTGNIRTEAFLSPSSAFLLTLFPTLDFPARRADRLTTPLGLRAGPAPHPHCYRKGSGHGTTVR